MSTITKTRYQKRVVNKQEWLFITRILRFGKKGIQVSTTAEGKGRFWIDTEHYYKTHQIDLADDFSIKDPVKLVLRVDSYINKENEYTTKIHLVDIEKIEEQEMNYWLYNQPTWTIKMDVTSIKSTDIPGLLILEGTRVDSDDKEQEKYHIRYYNKDRRELNLGRYEVNFGLHTSSRIIQNDGEVYTKTEEYEVGGEKKTNTVYIPYLEADHIYALVTSKYE